jgi:hypothetical protein
MTTIRFLEAPTRRPGETGQAFIDRMLAELNSKGSASALPTPPQIVITAEAKPHARNVCRVRHTRDPASAAASCPALESEAPVVDATHGPFPVKECRGKLTAQEAPLDWRGRPDYRPTTKSWPPGPMGPDGRSTHRYVGPWPPKWASKWTKGPKS